MKQHLLLFSLLFTAGITQAETVTLELLNGDSITGTIIEELSDDQEKILDHPQLGRLTIPASSLKPTLDPPAWSTSITAGLIGNEKDGDSSLSTSLNAESKYKNNKNILVFKAGLNTNQSQDKGEPLDIKTQKGSAGFRYDYRLNDDFSFYSLTDYNYDGKNDSGVNSLLTGLGVSTTLIQNKTTEFTLSIGPSVQWTNGGNQCGQDIYCGNTYAGASFATDLSWKPTQRFKLELNNLLSTAITPKLKPGNSLIAKLKFYPSIYSKLFTSLQYTSTYQSMSTPELNNSASIQLGADF